MDNCETVARKAISHMIHSYFCLYDSMPKVGYTFSGQDISQELLDFAKNLCKSVDIMDHVSLSKAKAKQCSLTHEKKESEEKSDKTSNYEPSDDSDASMEEDTDDDATEKKTQTPISPHSPKTPKQTVSPSRSPTESTASDRPRSHHKKKACRALLLTVPFMVTT